MKTILSTIIFTIMTVTVWGADHPINLLRPGIVKIITKAPNAPSTLGNLLSIFGTEPHSDNLQFSSGFIIQIRKDRLLIATAAHVVAHDTHPKILLWAGSEHIQDAIPTEVLDLPDPENSLGIRILELRDLSQIHPHPRARIRALPIARQTSIIQTGQRTWIMGQARREMMAAKRGYLVSQRNEILEIDLPGLASEDYLGGPIVHQGEVVGLSHKIGTYWEGLDISHLWKILHSLNIQPEDPGLTKEKPPWYSIEWKRSYEPANPRIINSYRLPPRRNGDDGTPMVLIRGGSFIMGTVKKEIGDPIEKPAHVMRVRTFYLDQYEVSVEQYQKFLEAKAVSPPAHWQEIQWGKDAHKPVIGVNWYQTHDYCEWMGKRLPNEAEWERAARGLTSRLSPWGAMTPDSTRSNYGHDQLYTNAYAERLQNVGSYESGRSQYGAYDMAGNVREWVSSYHEKYKASRSQHSRAHIIIPGWSGKHRIVRGGSWFSQQFQLRSTYRDFLPPYHVNDDLGFRCAQDAQ